MIRQVIITSIHYKKKSKNISKTFLLSATCLYNVNAGNIFVVFAKVHI